MKPIFLVPFYLLASSVTNSLASGLFLFLRYLSLPSLVKTQEMTARNERLVSLSLSFLLFSLP